MNGITEIADSLSAELKQRLPKQRRTQRVKLALLVATMLDVRSANLMDLAAGLPRQADRTGPLGNAQRYMRYQWITRLLGNPLVISDEIMEPFSREVLERAAASDEPLTLILDQSKMSDRHQVLMLALRCGERALPLAWRVEATDGAIGFETQKALLDAVAPWLPAQAKVRLMGDRFYGTADLIGWCQERAWDYRLRLKGNLVVFDGTGKTTTGKCAKGRVYYLEGSIIWKMSNSPAGGPGPTSASSMIRVTPSPGSSPCRNNPAICGPLSILSAGASSRCFQTSNRAASASRIPSSATLTASTA
jgi:hypothetical protein